ncbi:MAG TPA: VOC family protein [Steroidobacteraceae bacterium]|nr:VOC family protein [Steroidobacteraceae bacterium]
MDHAFIGCAEGAPEAAALLRLGLVEGPGNTHPGQGTANRRFFFENFMLELVWVSDPAEAQNDRTRRTRLWERCGRRDNAVSPFGIIFRPTGAHAVAAPFPTWDYAPVYLPPGLTMQVAEGTALHEPELFYLPFLKRAERGSDVKHALPIRRICGLSVGVRGCEALSATSRCAEQQGLISYFEAPQPMLEILFAGPAGLDFDLRPTLPLIFRSAPG